MDGLFRFDPSNADLDLEAFEMDYGPFGADVHTPVSDAIRKPSRDVAVATMAAALRQASKELGHPVDDTLLRLMLGQMLGAEGSMPGLWSGGGYTLRGTNNIGAAQVPGGAAGKAFAAARAAVTGWGAFAHKDSNPGGDDYIGWYYMAPSALEAARHWLTGYGGTKNVLAQNPRTPEDYARIMYQSGYYTGTSKDSQKEIAKYASAISRGMPSPSVMNGPANDPSALSVDPSQFDTLDKRKITEALFNKAKAGKSGGAWSYLLPASWQDLVRSNGVVWFGPSPVGSMLVAGAALERALMPVGGALLGMLLGGFGGLPGVLLGGILGGGIGYGVSRLGIGPGAAQAAPRGAPGGAPAAFQAPAAWVPPTRAPVAAPAAPKAAVQALATTASAALYTLGWQNPATQAAVKAWQVARGGLDPDGHYGPASARALAIDLAPAAAPAAFTKGAVG